MSKGSRFIYDEDKFYAVAPANIIVGSKKKLKYLAALLNSRLIYFSMRNYYMGGGIEGELKSNNLLRIPIPNPESDEFITDKIIFLVEEILVTKTRNPQEDI